MTDYLTEQEQVEILKNWIKQYSLVILASVALTAAIIAGWRFWQQRAANTLSHASSVYDEMLTLRARNDLEGTQTQAQKLYRHYAHTTYGQMAAFMLARAAANDKNYQHAEKYLQSILDQSRINPLRQIARIRLARVLIAEQKPEQAVNILEKVEDKRFNGLTNEVKGDAYVTLNNVQKAREAYQQALLELPNADSIRPLLQMKYDNLTSN